jgi:hypothetical protein
MAEAKQAVEEKAATAIAKRPGDDALEMGFGSGESFALLQRAANILANSTLVPSQYQGNLPNCIIALNMATRLRADPLMVMQNLYLVQGRPAWSAQFLIATINQCGRFTALRYEWQSEKGKPDWGCRAWAVEKSTGEKLYGTWITWELANAEGWVNKNGSKWKTMPQQMFVYRAGAWFVKAYAPELSMGLPTAEEMLDIETLQVAPGVYEPTFNGEEIKPEPENGERANGDQAEDLASKLRASRAATRNNVAPYVEAEAEQVTEDQEKGEEVAEAKAEEATQAAPEAISKPSNDAEDARETLASLFAEVAKIHGQQVATDRLETATGRRKVETVKPEKLSAGIDVMLQMKELRPGK